MPPPFNRLCSCCPARWPRVFGKGMAKKDTPRFRLCLVCDLLQEPKAWFPQHLGGEG